MGSFKGKRKIGLRLSYKKPSGFYRSKKTIKSPSKSPTPKKFKRGPVGSTPLGNKSLDLQLLSDIVSPIPKQFIASPSPKKGYSKRKLIYLQPSKHDHAKEDMRLGETDTYENDLVNISSSDFSELTPGTKHDLTEQFQISETGAEYDEACLNESISALSELKIND